MKPYPFKDRRQHPRIPGMVVTMPGDLDDDQLIHILPHHTCDELGVCQGRGDCDCPTPPEAGNFLLSDTGHTAEFSPVQAAATLAAKIIAVLVACALLGTICAAILTAGHLNGLTPAETASVILYLAGA